ncbi:NUDIX domain-containing protein [Nocardiopsis sp. RSe5-2]|uniref:NUDIX domain-containing protein n=1 Tax=Nocardiopsis endophytica TaxID=3018445 RepID=A0ABT4TZM5_9ACTN|nr:NUDIX domain-containing protein [Nocardiopsis endophytica]MDA2810148.1 NUDIX domain-containing protein [Nocardiopsis endophytica]
MQKRSEDTGSVPATAATLPVTVDIVALTVRSGRLQVLVVERGIPPFAGRSALPGGFVLPGETLETAAARELAEETGIVPPGHMEQLRSYGPYGRDPRGPVLTVAYLLLAPSSGLPQAGGDTADATWVPVEEAAPADGGGPVLAFDHDRILADGVERARAKLEYSPLATSFCREEFTIAELRAVYEAVWGTRLDARNFHRKATDTPGFLEPTGRTDASGPGRPAELYRLAPGARPSAAVLHPPLLRPRRP